MQSTVPFTATSVRPRIHVTSPLQRELLALSIRSAGKSIPVLLLGAAILVWNGMGSAQPGMATAVAVLAVATCLWRVVIVRRFDSNAACETEAVHRFSVGLVLCSLLAGTMWAVATWGIYPSLNPDGKALHLVAMTGLVALAGHFMSLVKWSYPMLVGPSIGSLITVCLLEAQPQSVLMAALLTVYAATTLRAGKHYRETTATSIEHRLALEFANADLVRAKKQADDSVSATSGFLATMSHEIRTPMNGVLGSLDMLRRSQLDEDDLELVRAAAECGGSLMALLNDALDRAKVESGRIELHLAPTSLHSVAATAINLFQGSANGKGVRILLTIDENVPDWVVTDAQRLKQVLLNLVSNAVKFTHAGSVIVRLTNTGESVGLVRVLFEIQDSGRGMTQEEVNRLFVPFSQVGSDGGGVPAGTGLGLSISKALIEVMGGQIEVRSQSGIGTVFQFELELPPHAPPVAQSASRLDRPSAILDAMTPLDGTVLVVDDDAVNRLVARSMLESFGLKVVEAPDGIDALAAARQHDLDLILMDCQMPGMDGYACSRSLRQREIAEERERIPIIALTADAFQDDVHQALASGMDAHLSKPYSRLQLRNEVAQWL